MTIIKSPAQNLMLFVFLFSFFPYLNFAQEMELSLDPPGTIRLTPVLYMDKTPVTNLMYLEYLTSKHFLADKGFHSFEAYQKSVEDTLKSLPRHYPSYLLYLQAVDGKVFKTAYIKDSYYMHYPVLGVSKELAADFCQWRTEMVEYLWRTNPGHIENKAYAGRILYRLPGEEELSSAKAYFQENGRLLLGKGKHPLRFKIIEKPEDFTLYRLSEYTQSNELYGENYKGIEPDSFPNDVTGFRCVCEVLPEDFQEGE